MNRLIYTLLLIIYASPSYGLNALEQHPSPYINMHKDDLIQWKLLNKSNFDLAKSRNKLIYVSIGYFSCYWCHVLQRESFKNKEIAQLLNKHMINIIVDRELEPDFDAYMLRFVKELTGRGGWPLNIILTPDGFPILGFVYLPQEQFHSLMVKVLQEWETDKIVLGSSAKKLAMQNSEKSPSMYNISNKEKRALLASFKNTVFERQDEFEGGFGQQSKFPHTPLLKALMCSGDEDYTTWLKLTLDNMASKGLRDHINGGFFRYTTDPGWLQPHFEKMLYDNSQLAELYFLAYVRYGDPKYLNIAIDTIDFIWAHLKDRKNVGIFSSSSAVDNKGVDGGGFLYSEAELNKIFAKEKLVAISQLWQLDKMQLDHGALPIPIETATRTNLYSFSRNRMRQYFRKNPMGIDSKKLTSWNALSLQTLVTAYKISKRPELLLQSRKIASFLRSRWIRTSLYRMIHKDIKIPATLEDYAYTIQALHNFTSIENNQADKTMLKSLLQKAWNQFYDQGWKSNSFLPYLGKSALLPDTMLPSASAILINISLKHKMASARAALKLGYSELKANSFWHATHLLGNLNKRSVCQ